MSGKYCDVLEDWPGSDDNQENQYLSDLADILAKPEGYRVYLGILKDLGLGGPLSTQPETVACYNLGLTLLERAGLACPDAAARLVTDCFRPLPMRNAE